MSCLIDLTGMKFDRLIVIERSKNNDKGRANWLCKCECGNTIVVSSISLRSNRSHSCGCSRIIDLSGQKFGKLTVIKRFIDKSKEETLWLCRCDCGKEKVVVGSSLKSGYTKSCGCLVYLDLIGYRFKKLVVIEKIGKIKSGGKTLWLCRCDCGNEITTSTTNLRSGDTKSCGCLRKETINLCYGEASLHDLYKCYKDSAKRRGYLFSLDLDLFKKITKENCFYCGAEPSQIKTYRGCYGEYIYNGIDRVDNKKDYTPDNVVPCCNHCNKAKRMLELNTFYDWIIKAYNYSAKDKKIFDSTVYANV